MIEPSAWILILVLSSNPSWPKTPNVITIGMQSESLCERAGTTAVREMFAAGYHCIARGK